MEGGRHHAEGEVPKHTAASMQVAGRSKHRGSMVLFLKCLPWLWVSSDFCLPAYSGVWNAFSPFPGLVKCCFPRIKEKSNLPLPWGDKEQWWVFISSRRNMPILTASSSSGAHNSLKAERSCSDCHRFHPNFCRIQKIPTTIAFPNPTTADPQPIRYTQQYKCSWAAATALRWLWMMCR